MHVAASLATQLLFSAVRPTKSQRYLQHWNTFVRSVQITATNAVLDCHWQEHS
jgi:hypothetical protein